MTRFILGFWLAFPALADPVQLQTPGIGILLLAHGGTNKWNDEVMGLRSELAKKFPVEVALGMADPGTIQPAVDSLAAKRVKKIIAVPLFISSHSEVMDQTRFVLGISKDPSKEFMHAAHAHMMAMTAKRIQTDLAVILAPALDDHPVVAQILLDRAREMSRDPSKESVVLVGHGPLNDADNAQWLKTMESLAQTIQKQGGFASVQAATLRDDAPQSVQKKADDELRSLVRSLSTRGRVLVVPDLIAEGGIERHIPRVLNGLFYEWKGKPLLPDSRIVQWIEEDATKSSASADMRQYKDEGRTPSSTLRPSAGAPVTLPPPSFAPQGTYDHQNSYGH